MVESAPRFFGPMLIANDFAVTLAFYRQTLGLPVEGALPYAECRTEAATFSIVDGRFWAKVNGTATSVVRGEPPTPHLVLAVLVPDVDEAFERLMSMEVKFQAPPTNRPEMGLRNAFLRDPDGRMVEIAAPIAPPPG